jgi:2-dehydropantoate 2-reductase
VVRHSNDWADLVFGEQDGRMDGKAAQLAAALGNGPGLKTSIVPDILDRMWEKMVFIATLAGATVLFRAAMGDILRGGGEKLVMSMLERNEAVAAAMGHPPSEQAKAAARKVVQDRSSTVTASLLRDLEGGGPTEADHILGFMAEAAHRAGIPDELQRAAWVHARAQEERRARGG